MRNIRVADQSEWIVDLPSPVPRRPHSRTASWLATLVMMLLVPALLLPLAGALAASSTISASPQPVAPGQTVTVSGSGLVKSSSGSLVLDGGIKLAKSFLSEKRVNKFKSSIPMHD